RWRDGGPRARFVAAARGRVLGSGELVARASGAWTGDRVELPFVMIQGPAVRASYRGAIDLPAAGLGWSSRGDLMAELDLAAAPPSLVPAGTAGRVSARGIVEAPSDLLPAEFRGTMSWRGVRTRGLAVPDGKGLVTRRDSGLGIEAGLAGARLDALVTASDEGPRLDASIGWADVEAVELLQRVLGRETGLLLAAWTDGRAEVSGPLRDVQAWRGRGELSRLVLEGPSVVVRQERAAPFVLEPGGRVRLLEGLPLSSDAHADVGLTIGGWVDLFGPEAGRIELTGTGIADLRLIEVLDPDLVATGTVETSVEASGTLASPRFSGAITLRDGRVRHLTLNEALDGVAARAVLDGSRVRIESAECRLGGGTLKLNNMRRGENEIVLAGWLPDRVDVSVLARDVALSLPRMVFGRYDADLTIVGAASEPEINGDVVVLAGRYARPFGFGRLIGSRTRLLDPGVGISSWMSRVGLRVRLLADESFVVDNDMARLETSVRLGVGGTLGQPLLSGTISLLDGGRIDFRGVEYEVLSGQVLLDDLDENPVRLRVRAATEISGYRVRLDLDASTEEVDYQLSSTPALTEADILSLLVSGETLAERGGGSGLIGADMATAYFGSEIGELLLSGAAERLLGLTHFQLAPSRVGPEARPTARLTLGRRIDDRTLALYSRDLSSEGEDIYRLERELTRRLRLSLSQESLGGVGVDLRWLKRIGEAAAGETASARPSETLASVTVRGLPGGVDAPSTRRLGLRRGKRLRRADRLEAREALRRVLVGNGYLEAVIDDETERREDGKVDLVFDVAPGDRWLLVSEGPGRRSRRAEELLVDLWTTTLFRPELLREAERVIKEAFGEEGFAAASIEVLRPDPGERRIVVRVDPGPRVTVGDVKLEGVDLLRERDVRTQILSRPASGLGLLSRTTYKPRLELEDVSAIRALYESRGYLEARVDSRVRFKRDGSEVVLTFVVDEGAQARVGRVRVEGPWPEELGPATPRALEILEQENGAGLERDERRREPVFLPENFERARRALRSALDDAGYYEAKVTARPELSDGEVHVTFGTSPGPRGVVEEVRLERLERTRERLVRSAIRLEPGEPLTQRAIRETERALFRLGLFRDVDVAHGPAGDDPERRIVTITFQEIPPVSFLGTIGFDTEERLRATAAVSHDNIAGMGRTGTLQGFASDRQVGARVTLEDPTLLKQRVEGLVSLGWLEEEREGFDLESVELALEVGSRRNRTSRWRAGYELRDDRFHNVELDPDALAEVLLSERGRLEPIRLGSLRGSWLHDRRDDPFLPGSGWIARSDVGVWARP
ncbi:MAG: translocation/assembly module TamB domain-containing protein, partial [Acidobacteriota bacterium]|nr:translocation/assembly module TamB domain-containing protein [Acidobacteriota bacterium]